MGNKKEARIEWVADKHSMLGSNYGISGTVRTSSLKTGQRLFEQMTQGHQFSDGSVHIMLKHGEDIIAEIRHREAEVLP